MSELTHIIDGGFMEKRDGKLKCQKCGYSIREKDITKAYLQGIISLPFRSGPAKMSL
jgi:hypothetical protein